MKKTAIIDYKLCHPEKCKNGICKVVAECTNKLIKQEEPYEMPDLFPDMCLGCAECVKACPFGALKMI